MTITWGSYDGNARLGVEAVRTSYTNSAETWSIKTYIGRKYTTTWDQTGSSTWALSGAISGSGTISVASGGSTSVLIASRTVTINRVYGSTQSKSVTFSVNKFSSYNPPAVTVSFTVTARPYEAPSPVTSLSGSYVATNKVKASWSRSVSTARPISSIKVGIQREGGTWSYSTISGTSTSWTSGTLSAGYRYRIAVKTIGAGGESAWAYTSYVAVTPTAPSNVTASRVNTADILISWTKTSSITGSTFEVWDGSTLVGSNITGTSWTHGAPSLTVSHQYRVRETVAGLYSPYSAYSATVQLLSAPLAPTDLSPNGENQPTGTSVKVSWVHNPVDQTAQTAFEIQYRTNGGSWTTKTGTTTSSVTLPVSTLTSGTLVEYQVRTKGSHANFSPWSPTASFTMYARPTATVSIPTSISSDLVTATITTPISGPVAWEATLLYGSSITETKTGYGASPITVEFTDVPNGTTVKVQARVMSHVWSSTTTSATVTVAYTPPPTPALTAVWDTRTASVTLTITNPTSGTITTVSNMLQRRYAGGAWETIDEDTEVNATITDPTPALNMRVEYRVAAVASTGVRAWSSIVSPAGVVDDAHYINYGDGIAQTVRLRYNPTDTVSPSLDTIELVTFAGQTVPTALLGPETSVTRNISGLVTDHDDPDLSAVQIANMFYQIATIAAPVMIRARDHDPVTGVVSGMKIDRMIWGGYTVAFTHTQAN